MIPWDDFDDLLAPFYSPDVGRPAEHPVLMLKLEYLRYHHNLSDREVIARSVTDPEARTGKHGDWYGGTKAERVNQPTRRTASPLLGQPQSVHPGGDGLHGHEHQTPRALDLRADPRSLRPKVGSKR